jgi:hypothetical protein
MLPVTNKMSQQYKKSSCRLNRKVQHINNIDVISIYNKKKRNMEWVGRLCLQSPLLHFTTQTNTQNYKIIMFNRGKKRRK